MKRLAIFVALLAMSCAPAQTRTVVFAPMHVHPKPPTVWAVVDAPPTRARRIERWARGVVRWLRDAPHAITASAQ